MNLEEEERQKFRSYGIVKKSGPLPTEASIPAPLSSTSTSNPSASASAYSVNDPRRPRKKKKKFGLSELIQLDHHVNGITGVPNLTNEVAHIITAVRGTRPSKKARRRFTVCFDPLKVQFHSSHL
ncbi:hypothetical protein T439DRAFT_328184 [Meredithblackwellia eburnea MCA 4105]